MPYFLYKVFPNKNLELITSFDQYREARNNAREQRAQADANADYTVKMIFAKNDHEAEHLLQQEREPRPLGEDA